MAKSNTLKTRTIKRLNALLGDWLMYNSNGVSIVADKEGHWDISYHFGLSNLQVGIWDEERESSPTWKIVWDILKKIESSNALEQGRNGMRR
jgi:hypothetical protein